MNQTKSRITFVERIYESLYYAKVAQYNNMSEP